MGPKESLKTQNFLNHMMPYVLDSNAISATVGRSGKEVWQCARVARNPFGIKARCGGVEDGMGPREFAHSSIEEKESFHRAQLSGGGKP